MASIYDNIKTAKDLVSEVMTHGFSTKQEDVIRAQDIFGHSAIEDLVALANDIGRNDENGNPDPKGTWSSGRRETRSTFYSILFQIWNYETATRFWNEHTNPDHERIKELEESNKALRSQLEAKKTECETEHKGRLQETAGKREAQDKATLCEATIHELNMTIMELKAKLYDLMEERTEKK